MLDIWNDIVLLDIWNDIGRMPTVELIENDQKVVKRYYISGDHVGFDEDTTHEYKGHVNFSYDQVPQWAKDTEYDRASRQPVSRVVNGFLNTGCGGTICLGVKDEGTAFGIYLTGYKMDHIMRNLEDLMSRYRPQVAPHRYSLEFVPVVNSSMSDDEIKKAVAFDPSSSTDTHRRLQAHQLRTSAYCWCDKDLQAQCNVGYLPLQYVIEVHIMPWDSKDPRNTNAVGVMKAQPIHEDECGNVYIRRGSCTTLLKIEEIQKYAKQLVERHYGEIAKELNAEKEKLLNL